MEMQRDQLYQDFLVTFLQIKIPTLQVYLYFSKPDSHLVYCILLAADDGKYSMGLKAKFGGKKWKLMTSM